MSVIDSYERISRQLGVVGFTNYGTIAVAVLVLADRVEFVGKKLSHLGDGTPGSLVGAAQDLATAIRERRYGAEE